MPVSVRRRPEARSADLQYDPKRLEPGSRKEKVPPAPALIRRVFQQVSGMKHRDHGDGCAGECYIEISVVVQQSAR